MCTSDQHLQREDLYPRLVVVLRPIRRLDPGCHVLVLHITVPPGQVPVHSPASGTDYGSGQAGVVPQGEEETSGSLFEDLFEGK